MSELTREMSELAGQWQYTGSSVNITSSSGFVLLTKFNALRWAALISANVAGATSNGGVHFTDNLSAATAILFSVPLSPPVILNFRDHGGLVQQAMYGAPPNTTTYSLILTEVLAVQ